MSELIVAIKQKLSLKEISVDSEITSATSPDEQVSSIYLAIHILVDNNT